MSALAKAEERIREAKRTNATALDLSGLGLTTLPLELGELQNLKSLDLSGNQLSTLPEAVGQLQNLQSLDLSGNQLSSLPEALAGLQNLRALDLVHNKLNSLPEAIGTLQKLEALALNDNKLSALPRSLGGLPELSFKTHAYVVAGNEDVISSGFTDNPLSQLPPEVAEQGDKAILEYLRKTFKEGDRQWVSKLLIVGQGGVGKTSVLRALKEESFDFREKTTHGIAIKKLEVEHPSEESVTMTLNTWDFGGQEIYHATHQFFLTSRSLFLLVWNAREDYEAGKLPYWLDSISTRAPNSPVLIVATHTDERPASLPLEELKRKFPQVVGHHEVSNKPPRDGIEGLRQAIADAAAGLPLMGETWGRQAGRPRRTPSAA